MEEYVHNMKKLGKVGKLLACVYQIKTRVNFWLTTVSTAASTLICCEPKTGGNLGAGCDSDCIEARGFGCCGGCGCCGDCGKGCECDVTGRASGEGISGWEQTLFVDSVETLFVDDKAALWMELTHTPTLHGLTVCTRSARFHTNAQLTSSVQPIARAALRLSYIRRQL